MGLDERYPQRKQIRLITHDYNAAGVYFITICVRDRLPVLSDIIRGSGCDVPRVQLSGIGKIVEKYILSSEKIPGISVKHYIIMPDHVHMIVYVHPERKITSEILPENVISEAPSPANDAIPRVISALKRLCHKEIGQNIFQRSYNERIIRSREEYDAIVRYMNDNPKRWSMQKGRTYPVTS